MSNDHLFIILPHTDKCCLINAVLCTNLKYLYINHC